MPQSLLLLLGSPVARFDECFDLKSTVEGTVLIFRWTEVTTAKIEDTNLLVVLA
jgi:hypothetical protein